MIALLALLLTFAGCTPSEPPDAATAERISADNAARAAHKGERPKDWWKGESGWCGEPLTRDDLDASLKLGRTYLLANQRDAGNFNYEYDWKKKELVDDDNQVRQAGATWGVALLHRDAPSAETRAAAEKAIAFWRQHDKTSEDGRRWTTYPGEKRSKLGTVSLVALAHIELLRSEDPELTGRDELRAALDGYLKQILHVRAKDGRFHDKIAMDTGDGSGNSSPYSDGEALLALVKAARYLGRDDLWPTVLDVAEKGHALNVTKALAEHPDSNTTKGYYQWGSMSWYEIATSDQPEDVRKIWGDHLMDLAVWMIDTHYTLRRTRNTAYAYEGIIPAYAVAKARKDPRESKLDCVVQLGMRHLTTWQVGHPLAIPFLAKAPKDDPKALGGIQNHSKEALLRVDVVQHQMHAVLMARELWARK